MAKQNYKTIPQTENGPRVRCLINDTEWLVTWNKNTDKHTLWLCNNGEYEKITTKNSPLELYDIIDKLSGGKSNV